MQFEPGVPDRVEVLPAARMRMCAALALLATSFVAGRDEIAHALRIAEDDVICAPPALRATGYRFIDLSTYWINSDGATARRRLMELHLHARLRDGACATRIRALSEADARESGTGAFLARLWRSGARAGADHGGIPAGIVATTFSHLKALFAALALEPPDAPGFLILEDDVDFAPLTHYHAVLAGVRGGHARVHGPEKSSLRALAAQAAAGWSLVQLGALIGQTRVVPKRRWSGLVKLWRARGSPPLLEKRALLRNVSAAGAPPTAKRRAWPTAAREVACDLDPLPWSTVAYLVSPAAAAALVRDMFPVTLAADVSAGVRVRVERACYSPADFVAQCRQPWWKLVRAAEVRAEVRRAMKGGHGRRALVGRAAAGGGPGVGPGGPGPLPLLTADNCIVNHALYGPARTPQQAAEEARSGEPSPPGAWHEYIATPPLFSECAARDVQAVGVHAGRQAPVDQLRLRCYSKRRLHGWYEGLCDPRDACTRESRALLAERVARELDGMVLLARAGAAGPAPGDAGGRPSARAPAAAADVAEFAVIPPALRRQWVSERRAKLSAPYGVYVKARSFNLSKALARVRAGAAPSMIDDADPTTPFADCLPEGARAMLQPICTQPPR